MKSEPTKQPRRRAHAALTKRRIDAATLVQLRVDRGWSRTRLHEESGVSLSYLKYIEDGERHPSTIVTKMIAKALGVDIDAFSEPWVDEPAQKKAS